MSIGHAMEFFKWAMAILRSLPVSVTRESNTWC